MVRIFTYILSIIIVSFDNSIYFANAIQSNSILSNVRNNEENSEQSDNHKLKENVHLLTVTMSSLQEQINRFNDLYINRLDQKLTALAVSVANLDSNVRNIQDRAHVWDTFQLHVTAWNEQIKSLDKKADLISSGQEKIMLLEGKMSFLLNLEYNSQRALNKLSNLEDKFDILEKNIKNKENNQPSPIYEEFAVRGALSTLKIVEQKVDNTYTLLHQFTHKKHKTDKIRTDNNTTSVDKNKCTLPLEMEELIKDVASKIDLIHDKVVIDNNDDNEEENITEKNCDNIISSTEDINKYHKLMSCPSIEKIDDILNKLGEQQNILLNISTQIISSNMKINNVNNISSISIDFYKINDIEYPTIDYDTTTFDDYSINTSDDIIYEESTTEYIYSTTDVYENNIYNDVGNISLDIINRLSTVDNVSKFCKYPESERFCDHNGNVVIQNRIDGKENFSRSWLDYKWGFGDSIDANYWIGNEAIHYLTTKATTILRIELEDFNGNAVWAQYDKFEVGSEQDSYVLHVNGYNGNASDSLLYHNGSKFSTFDRTNDEAPLCCPCSLSYGGGWWFKSCFESNLNGLYYESAIKDDFRGIIWEKWQGDITLAKTKMAVKIIASLDN